MELAGPLGSSASQLLSGTNRSVSLSKQGQVRNLVKFGLYQNVPREPETHLELFHRETI